MSTEQQGYRSGNMWITVAGHEMRELWLAGRGLTILLTYSVLLSVLTFITAGNAELNLLDARETVSLVVKVVIAFGTLAALLASADAISGERERGTLEYLLLTPAFALQGLACHVAAPYTLESFPLCSL